MLQSRAFISRTLICSNSHISFQQIGFNGGVPIDEDFFIKNIAGKHNEDIASILFPDDHERGVKFLEDKEAMFRRFLPFPSQRKVKKKIARHFSLILTLCFEWDTGLLRRKLSQLKAYTN